MSIKLTSLTLSIALGLGLAASPAIASSDIQGKIISTKDQSFQTAHLKKKKSHRHCHTGIRNHKIIKTCHKHRHWYLHHIRKG